MPYPTFPPIPTSALENTMKKQPTLAVLAFATSLLMGGAALAQLPGKGDKTESADASSTRMRVKMERNDFLKSHRWDETAGTWMLQKGVEPPEGVMSRAEVKAARDTFISKNRWDETAGGWKPLTGEPRNMATMSRAEVRADTARFMKSHRWDEATQLWELKPMPKPKS
jgi:hypothetical protein